MLKNFGEHQGYIIMEQVRIGYYLFSMGHNPNAPKPYVVWQSNSDAPTQYRWPRYMKSKNDALENLRELIVSEVKGILQNIDRMEKRPEIAYTERSDAR
jgi:hypothetical protein